MLLSAGRLARSAGIYGAVPERNGVGQPCGLRSCVVKGTTAGWKGSVWIRLSSATVLSSIRRRPRAPRSSFVFLAPARYLFLATAEKKSRRFAIWFRVAKKRRRLLSSVENRNHFRWLTRGARRVVLLFARRCQFGGNNESFWIWNISSVAVPSVLKRISRGCFGANFVIWIIQPMADPQVFSVIFKIWFTIFLWIFWGNIEMLLLFIQVVDLKRFVFVFSSAWICFVSTLKLIQFSRLIDFFLKLIPSTLNMENIFDSCATWAKCNYCAIWDVFQSVVNVELTGTWPSPWQRRRHFIWFFLLVCRV